MGGLIFCSAMKSTLVLFVLVAAVATSKPVKEKLKCHEKDSECMVQWDELLKNVNLQNDCGKKGGSCVKSCDSQAIYGLKITGGKFNYLLRGPVDQDFTDGKHLHMFLVAGKSSTQIEFKLSPNKKQKKSGGKKKKKKKKKK